MNRLIPIIFVILALAVFFGYVEPTYSNRVQDLQGDIDELNQTLASAEEFQRQQSRLEARRAAIPQEEIDRLETFLPDNVDNIELILDLSAIATAQGVRITDIGVEGGQGDGNTSGQVVEGGEGVRVQSGEEFRSLSIALTATGTYEQFKRFLNDLEISLRTIDITEMAFSESETGVYDFDVRATVYWLE